MRSADFEREIEQAAQIGCPALPFLIDMSREEFEKLNPAWSRMLGTSPLVEYRRSSDLEEIVDRVYASARTLEISLDETVVPAQIEPPAPMCGADLGDGRESD